MTRRDFLLSSAALAAAPLAANAQEPKAKGGFALAKLPYAYDALEPAIDAETMTIHHTKHQQTYVDNLNKALAGQPAWLAMPIEEVVTKVKEAPEAVRAAVRNNAGGVWNHDFFWGVMAKPGTAPKGELLEAINASFTDLAGFQKVFTAAAVGRFGSGWAWLVPGAKGGKAKPLAIVTSPNQDNPLMDGGPRPILGVDVWEHAYYLKYRNLRAKYVEAWFTVVNWDAVAANLAKKSA